MQITEFNQVKSGIKKKGIDPCSHSKKVCHTCPKSIRLNIIFEYDLSGLIIGAYMVAGIGTFS